MGEKNHLGFDKFNDIMSLWNIYSFSSAFSEENKPLFPQNAGKLRLSLWVFKSRFTKYQES